MRFFCVNVTTQSRKAAREPIYIRRCKKIVEVVRDTKACSDNYLTERKRFGQAVYKLIGAAIRLSNIAKLNIGSVRRDI